MLSKHKSALIPILFYSILFTSYSPSSQNTETDIAFDVKIQILGEGTVTPNPGSFEAQTNIKLQAIPASGFYFDRWEGFEQVEEKEEVEPQTQRVVWEWNSADQMVQEFDSTTLSFGSVAAHPENIDLNYSDSENGDLIHANMIYYDADRDVIFLSVNFYSEIWVIPHQYDMEKTKTDLGDLVYRFGNPKTYKGEHLFYNNHHPSLV